MPDIIIRPTRATDDARQECEGLSRAMRDRGFESKVEMLGEKEAALGTVDLVVQITDRAPEHTLPELVDHLTQHGWKKVREAEKQSPQQNTGMSSKGSAHRIVMIAAANTRTIMERSER
jgi:hypothetical protein